MTEKISNPNRNFFVPGFLRVRREQYLISFILIIFFASAGLLVSLLFPPEYEAESFVITNLELVTDTNVTEIMVDSQLELVRRIMYHPDIVAEVLLLEEAVGNPITYTNLMEKSQIERRLMTNIIKVRDADPETAARIANHWAKVSYENLSQAYSHALLVSDAHWTITSIEDCQSDPLVNETEFCQNLTPEEVARLKYDAHEVILAEGPQTWGLTKDLKVSHFQPASIPKKPIQGARANLILAGGMIGLLLSLIVYELPEFKRGFRG